MQTDILSHAPAEFWVHLTANHDTTTKWARLFLKTNTETQLKRLYISVHLSKLLIHV